MLPDDYINYPAIVINGQRYSPGNLDTIPDEPIAGIRGFLEAWWDSSARLKVRTSGSTGEPKEITVTKKALVVSATRTINYFNLKPGMKALLCLPVNFIAGKMMIARALAGQLELVTVASTGHPLRDLSQDVDFAAFTPMQIYNELTRPASNLHHLNKVIIGGDKVSARLEEMLQQQSFEAYETYGMTETLSHVAVRRVNGSGRQERFTPLQGVTTGVDKRGCLTLMVKSVTRDTIITNDLVELYPDKSFKITGRADDIINSGGIKIIPGKLEEKIGPLICKPFVISAIPDERLGQKIVLVTEGEINNPSVLISELKKHLQGFEVPSRIYSMEQFPRTPSGKVIRSEIIKLISG